MPTVNPSAFGPKPFWVDAAGNPATSYKLFMYAAGSTSTKQNSYTNSTGAVANTNPIILNALGQTPNELWWDTSLLYKVVLAPSTDTDPPTNPVWTIDNLAGMNSNNGGQSVNEWILYSAGPTYISANSFSVAGNQTQTFHIGRRLQLTTVGGMVYGRITNSVFAAQTIVAVQMDGAQILDSSLSAVYYSILTNDILALPERIASTSGTNTYTATVGIVRLVIGDEYKINFSVANDGAIAPTLALDSGTAFPIVTQNSSIPVAGSISGAHIIRWSGTNFIVLNPLPQQTSKIQTITAIANTPANGLTIGYAGGVMDFRSTPLTSGVINQRAIPPLSLIVPSGATLGTINAIQSRLIPIAIDNSGTIELAVVNISGGINLNETTLISTTAISAGANAANVIYSTTGRTNVPFRVLGCVDSTQATAGTWATAPSLVQGFGGQAVAVMSSIGYGQGWRDVTASRSINTTYYNLTGKPIQVMIEGSSGVALHVLCNGTNVGFINGSSIAVSVSFIVPPGGNYIWNSANGSISFWSELS